MKKFLKITFCVKIYTNFRVDGSTYLKRRKQIWATNLLKGSSFLQSIENIEFKQKNNMWNITGFIFSMGSKYVKT